MDTTVDGNSNTTPIAPTEKAVAIYHVVYQQEGFDETANALFQLVRDAERTQSGKRRILFLDIEGHRNDQGGYDQDMFELQRDFVLGFLMPFIAEAHLPLGGHVINPNPQQGDIPEELLIGPAKE